MFLSKLFDQTHFQQFAPGATRDENDAFTARVLRMIEASGIDVTHRITDDGVEFGFTDPKHADTLRLNLMAMEGDFGAHTHTQHFDNVLERDQWTSLATELADALDITFDGSYFDDRLELDFESSEEAIILKGAMTIAWENSPENGIAHGRDMQRNMSKLRADLHGTPSLG